MFTTIDLIGAIGAATVYVVLVGVVVGYSALRAAVKLRLFAVAAAWLALIVTVAAVGGFARGATGPVPGPVLAFGTFLALLSVAWLRLPGLRQGLLSLPYPLLAALHAGRLGGLAFVLLGVEGRLSAPFAPVAGGGDMLVAALAIAVAVSAARRPADPPASLAVWNVAGALDLVVAILLGALSAPGTPFQLFTQEPGTMIFGSLPWVLVPTTLVPLYLLLHFTLAARLRLARASVVPPAVPVAGRAGGRRDTVRKYRSRPLPKAHPGSSFGRFIPAALVRRFMNANLAGLHRRIQ